MFKLPYGMLPGHWGLKGKSRERVKAEYELDGIERERRLIEINYDDENERDLELLKLERKNNHITKEEYDYEYARLVHGDTKEYRLIQLELDKKYEKIDELGYQKSIAEFHNDPWIGVISSDYNAGLTSDGFSFELDWNDEFVQMLKREGYRGATEDEIVEQWFEDKATEEYMKILSEEADDISETDDYSVPATHVTKEKTDDGKTRHS